MPVIIALGGLGRRISSLSPSYNETLSQKRREGEKERNAPCGKVLGKSEGQHIKWCEQPKQRTRAAQGTFAFALRELGRYLGSSATKDCHDLA
jgi:hypothetical protein